MMNGTDANSGIKHPGATLAAMLDLVDMSRKELSLRVGVSEKHIAAVIDGSRDVSLPFAKRLECVFGLPALEWLDMQVRYDEACFERKERAGVHPEEMDIPLRHQIRVDRTHHHRHSHSEKIQTVGRSGRRC